MLNEQVTHTNVDLLKVLRDSLVDFTGNQVASSGRSSNGDFMLEPLHHRVAACGGSQGGARGLCPSPRILQTPSSVLLSACYNNSWEVFDWVLDDTDFV